MKGKKYANYIDTYPDFPIPNVFFRDIFPLIAEVSVFKEMIEKLADKSKSLSPDKILSVEARGFIIGTALSLEMGISMLPARKKGKLPGEKVSYEYKLEYGTSTLQIMRNAIKPGERVLLADDVLATGGTTHAAIRLIKAAGGVPVGLASLIELTFLKGRKLIEDKTFQVISLVEYDE
ncbi:MAG: adenine phosphoribosyltransferase [SAR324 cluster bacterium]|nr:adenine phosphoribosyltransferase [SAR324 cluster bacterium]